MTGQKRFVSTGLLLTYALISKDVQTHLVKYTPTPVSSWFSNFKFVMGETPLSNYQWPLGLCAFYLLSVFLMRKYMQDKKPWDLYHFRVAHNAFLCLASLLMLAGCIKETIILFQKGGMEALFCDSNNYHDTTNAVLWYYLFYISKFYEFIDTYILVLRKKPLTVLHVFHHFITAILCWTGTAGNIPIQWATLILNTGVHVAMYYYYLTQTLGGDVWWKKHLTSAQITQFIIDLILLQGYFYYHRYLGMQCIGDELPVLFADAVLLSFLILFINFFLQTYKKGKKERSD